MTPRLGTRAAWSYWSFTVNLHLLPLGLQRFLSRPYSYPNSLFSWFYPYLRRIPVYTVSMFPAVDPFTQLHQIDRSSEWPTEIISVTTLLDVPIPMKFFNTSCSSLSQRASHLFGKLSELFLHSSNRFANGNSDARDAGLILSTVSVLRVIMEDELRSTRPFW